MLYVKDTEWNVETTSDMVKFDKDVARLGDSQVYDLTNALDEEDGIFLYNGTEFKAYDYGVKSSFDGKGCKFYISAKVAI